MLVGDDVPRKSDLPQEKAKPGDDEAEAHQGQPGTHPREQGPLGSKANARIFRLRLVFARLFVHRQYIIPC